MSKIREWCQVLVDSGVIPQMPVNIDATIYEQYVKYLESENAELHRRAEVAERALLTACVNLIKDEKANVNNLNMKLLVRVVYTNYLRKAKKELAEE